MNIHLLFYKCLLFQTGESHSEKINGTNVSKLLLFAILLIIDMVIKRCNGRFGCETINPTQKFTSMNLLQMFWVITWSWSFWPMRLRRLREAKYIRHWRTRWHFNSSFHSSLSARCAYQRFAKKWDLLWFSASIQPPYLKF